MSKVPCLVEEIELHDIIHMYSLPSRYYNCRSVLCWIPPKYHHAGRKSNIARIYRPIGVDPHRFFELQVPVEFQIVFDASGSILENPDVLIRMKDPTELTLVISLKEICTTLDTGSHSQIETALKTMIEAHHICKNNDMVIAAVSG